MTTSTTPLRVCYVSTQHRSVGVESSTTAPQAMVGFWTSSRHTVRVATPEQVEAILASQFKRMDGAFRLLK